MVRTRFIVLEMRTGTFKLHSSTRGLSPIPSTVLFSPGYAVIGLVSTLSSRISPVCPFAMTNAPDGTTPL